MKWILRLLLISNAVSGFLLLLSVLSVHLNPEIWWFPALTGLTFFYLFIFNLIITLIWVFTKRKYAIYSSLFLFIGFAELPKHIQFNIPDKAIENEYHIFTLNVRNFDLYNWSENKKTRDKILSLINSRNAEIICLQEFFNTTDPKHHFETLDTILEFENHYNSHVEYTTTVKNTEHWGIATFTSFPITGKGQVSFGENTNNVCIYTDMQIEGDTFRIYNMHLASVRFGEEDYKYLSDVTQNNMDINMQRSRNVMSKLKAGYLHRAPQVLEIKQHMSLSPHPIIVCGDFNDTPTSFTYHNLADNLKDSFRSKGSGLGSTYNGYVPFLRIDYILADEKIKFVSHEVINSDISDHYPVLAGFELGKNSDIR